MNYTLLVSGVMGIIIVMMVGYGLSEEPQKEIVEEENVESESRWFSHQFHNVSGMSIANETIYNGSCNVEIDISVRFDSEWGNLTLLVDDEEILNTKNNTNVEVMGDNLTITIRATGGDSHPDNDLADYYIVNMISYCS
jgi:hypothetical protein|tara:strand:+ start:169 stop:585 length:417 start_codon:yes stop_codon:yes gene_type:complete